MGRTKGTAVNQRERGLIWMYGISKFQPVEVESPVLAWFSAKRCDGQRRDIDASCSICHMDVRADARHNLHSIPPFLWTCLLLLSCYRVNLFCLFSFPRTWIAVSAPLRLSVMTWTCNPSRVMSNFRCDSIMVCLSWLRLIGFPT